MTKFLHKINKHDNYIKNVNEDHQFNITLCEDIYHLHYDKWIDPYNGHNYVEIGGLKWATMNVGANSVTDTGLYFQLGDIQGYTADQVGSGEGKKYFDENFSDYKWTNDGGNTFTKYNATDNKLTLDVSDDTVTAAWGGNWRMPTKDDYIALGDAVNTVWITNYQGSGINGLVCTDKTDSTKTLFFPACGYCENGSVYNIDSYGYYWSNFLLNYNVQYAFALSFDDGSLYWNSLSPRGRGCSVRGVAD